MPSSSAPPATPRPRAARQPAGLMRHWRIFRTWCDKRGRCPLPATPEVVAVFAGAEAAAGLTRAR